MENLQQILGIYELHHPFEAHRESVGSDKNDTVKATCSLYS